MQVSVSALQWCPTPITAVFACAVDPARFPSLFSGFGPIPALTRIELHQPLAVGVNRAVHSADGAVMQETVTAFDPPHQHAYRLQGIRPPLSWLVSSGAADWQFQQVPGGTEVRWTYCFTLTTPWVWPLAFPLLKLFMATAMQRCLAALARMSQQPPER